MTTSWLRPSQRPVDLSDHYPWCHANQRYMEADELVCILTGPSPSTALVLDARDDDAIGGHVAVRVLKKQNN